MGSIRNASRKGTRRQNGVTQERNRVGRQCSISSRCKVMVEFSLVIRNTCYIQISAKNQTINGACYHTHAPLVEQSETYSLVTGWQRQTSAHRNVQRYLQPVYSSGLNSCNYRIFYIIKMASGEQAFLPMHLLQEPIYKDIAYRNMAVQKLPELWDRCVNYKGEY